MTIASTSAVLEVAEFLRFNGKGLFEKVGQVLDGLATLLD